MNNAISRKDNRKTFRVTYNDGNASVSRLYPMTPAGEKLFTYDSNRFLKVLEAEKQAAMKAAKEKELAALIEKETSANIQDEEIDLFAIMDQY